MNITTIECWIQPWPRVPWTYRLAKCLCCWVLAENVILWKVLSAVYAQTSALLVVRAYLQELLTQTVRVQVRRPLELVPELPHLLTECTEELLTHDWRSTHARRRYKRKLPAKEKIVVKMSHHAAITERAQPYCKSWRQCPTTTFYKLHT